MKFLADEFRRLIQQTNLPTPALDQLYAYRDPQKPALKKGSAQIPLDWRPIWLGGGILASMIVATILVLSRRKNGAA
jgi:hypothetical protein